MKRSLSLLLIVALLSAGCQPGDPPPNPTPGEDLRITSIHPHRGPGGILDTIRGKGFSRPATDNLVFINRMQAEVISGNDSLLVVRVPRLAGTGPVAIQKGGALIMGPLFRYDTVWTVSTLAGTGAAGSADGAAAGASFDNPTGIVADPQGNIYVADSRNFTIRKISTEGQVTTYAGAAGQSGTADGTGNAARFNEVHQLAIDSSGNIYVADPYSYRIRKIAPGGVVTTLAGMMEPGYRDGAALQALFNQPFGVGVHTTGELFIADYLNHRVRKLSGGVVSTYAGSGANWNDDGPALQASFFGVVAVAADKGGNLYVVDGAGHTVRKVSPSGTVSTLAGGSQPGYVNGQGTAAKFFYPSGCIVDAHGHILVTDFTNNAIRRITPEGVVTSLAGGASGAADGIPPVATFRGPRHITVDRQGHYYVTDFYNHKVRKISAQ